MSQSFLQACSVTRCNGACCKEITEKTARTITLHKVTMNYTD